MQANEQCVGKELAKFVINDAVTTNDAEREADQYGRGARHSARMQWNSVELTRAVAAVDVCRSRSVRMSCA